MIESASGVGDLTLTTESFGLSGTATNSSSVLRQCETCDSGAKFKLNDWWEFEGEVQSGGTTYDATGRFRLNSRTAEIPDFGDLESGQFTQAFHFVGKVNATDGSAPALRLIGRGLATISFFRDEGGTILPSLIRYDFDAAAQTPEPATLALVASGLALVARRRTRRSRPGGHRPLNSQHVCLAGMCGAYRPLEPGDGSGRRPAGFSTPGTRPALMLCRSRGRLRGGQGDVRQAHRCGMGDQGVTDHTAGSRREESLRTRSGFAVRRHASTASAGRTRRRAAADCRWPRSDAQQAQRVRRENKDGG